MQFLKAILTILLAALFPLCGAASPSDKGDSNKTAYDFTFRTINGVAMPLSAYRGYTLLIVNTASKCGFTGQYDGLEQLWYQYHRRGLVVIGVPSNDFANQEPGSAQEIQDFCSTKYGVTFPITEKLHVSGKDADPFFVWLGQSLGASAMPQWNFYKYIINPQGKPVAWFLPVVRPTADRISQVIEQNLPPLYSLPQTE